MRDMSGEIRSQRLHVDMRRPEQVDEASLRYRVGIGGCYYLSDVEPQGAGIHVVPGGSRLVAEKMLAAPPEQALELYDGWKHLDDFPQTIEVTGKAGDFVLMHHLMPHCASRNRRATPRVVQFARFFRVEGEALHRAAHDDTRFSQSFLTALSPLGRKLIGIEPWLPKSES